MAAEATAPSSGSQFSTDQGLADNFALQLADDVHLGNSVISLSFVTAREVCGDNFDDNNFDELKATIAYVLPHLRLCTWLTLHSAHFTQHFQTPIHQVNLSVNVLDNNIMATPVENASPVLTEDAASPEVGLDFENEVANFTASSPASKKVKQKVARPPNAFIIYRKDWHLTAVAANPGLHNNDICK